MIVPPVCVSKLGFFNSHRKDQNEFLELIRNNDLYKIRSYINKSKDRVIQDNLGDTLLHVAIVHGAEQIAIMLILHYPRLINVSNNLGQLPLHYAVLAGATEIFKILLLKTDNLLAVTVNGDTILHLICRASNLDSEILQFFLNAIHGNLNAVIKANELGETPLHTAAQKAHHEAIIKLCQLGIDVNIRNITGDTPLHFAIQYCDELIVKTFIRFGAKVNVKNNRGCTVLHSLLQIPVDMNELKYIFILLMQAGINLSLKNNDMLTAIEVAEETLEPVVFEQFKIFYDQQCKLCGDGSIRVISS